MTKTKTTKHTHRTFAFSSNSGVSLTFRVRNNVVNVSVHGADAETFKQLLKQFVEVRQVDYNGKDKNNRWVNFLAEVTIFDDID
jgi:hypothetical protein